MSEPDVCVIGGGPAGLAAAISLRLAGASVILFESNQPPIDKACGEGLMPNTVAELKMLGVHLNRLDGYPFRGVRFIDGPTSASADFRGDHGLGVRRTHLHEVLANRATALGIDLRWNAKVIRRSDGSIASGTQHFQPGLLVAADGLHSRIRRSCDFPENTSKLRYGFRRHFAMQPWSNYVEIYCGRHRQIYVTPISTQEIGVALLTQNSHERIDDALQFFPELQERLKQGIPTSLERGAVTATRRLPRVIKPGLALIGDASGSVDAITGEGIGLAVEQAIALGEAFRAGDLQIYQRAHNRIGWSARIIGGLLLAFSKRPALQSGAIRALRVCPLLFAKILAAHVRCRSSISGTSVAGSGSASLPNPERLNSQS